MTNNTESQLTTVQQEPTQKTAETLENAADKKNWSLSLEGMGKFGVLLVIFTTIFGVAFQKGMFLEMGLQNTRGSYEIEEVFSSAFLGYIHILSPLINVEVTKVFMSFIWIAIGFVVLSAIIFVISKYNLKQTGPISKAINISKNPYKYVSDSLIKTTTFSAIIGLLLSLFATITTFIFIGALILLVLPAIAGVSVGQAYVNKYMRDPVCTEISAESLKTKYIKQCPQFTLHNINLSAQVILQNKDGYFLKLSNAFLYVSNDAKRCVYSHFNKSDEIKEIGIDIFKFEQEKIKTLCENITIGAPNNLD